MLSPDGSTIVKIEAFQGTYSVVRDPVGPAPWTTTPFVVPGTSATSPAPLLTPRWLSANGNLVVVARAELAPANPVPATVVNTSTGATAPFGGRFRESLAGGPSEFVSGGGQGTLLSPSGRMALLPVGGQLVLTDLWGAHLVGANEPLAADVYYAFGYTGRCTSSVLTGPRFFGTQWVTVRRPASWIALPTRYDVQLLADTTLLKGVSPAEGETVSAAWSGRPRYHRAKVTVTGADGRVVASEQRLPGGYYGACYQ